MNDTAFWLHDLVLQKIHNEQRACYRVIVHPSMEGIGGWEIEPSPKERCQTQHPTGFLRCPLVDGHDGPHWGAAGEIIHTIPWLRTEYGSPSEMKSIELHTPTEHPQWWLY